MRLFSLVVLFLIVAPTSALNQRAAAAEAVGHKAPAPSAPSSIPRARPHLVLPQGAPPAPDPPGKAKPEPRPAPRAAAPARKTMTPAETRAALEKLLRANPAPPSDAELAGFGTGVEDALVAIGRDEAVELQTRARAVNALANTPLPTTATRLFLFGLLSPRAPGARRPDAGAAPARGGEASTLLLRRALITLGWIGGTQVPDALAPLLSHSDPDVRADAALGLALTRLPKAAEYLRARLPLETDGRVRGHIARQLNVVDAALGQGTPAK